MYIFLSFNEHSYLAMIVKNNKLALFTSIIERNNKDTIDRSDSTTEKIVNKIAYIPFLFLFEVLSIFSVQL